MDIAICLEKLGLSNYHWGSDFSTYETLASKWPASNPPLPSKSDFQNVWNAIKNDVALIPIREKRNLLLQQSDWITFSDVNVSNKSEWISYRQQLRDITTAFPRPEDVVWPTPPAQ